MENRLIDALAKVLQENVGSVDPADWSSRASAPANPAEPPAVGIVVAFSLQGALQGELYLCPDEELLRLTLPDVSVGKTQETAAAWQALWERAASGLQQRLQSYGGLEVADCRATDLPAGAVPLGELLAGPPQEKTRVLYVFGDGALGTALAKPAPGAGESLTLAPRVESPGVAAIDRVIDVPLAVKLRFGQRQLTLRELLELNTGSLVELDQQVEEPVSLVLGDRVIARGEVVIVDGNYGMRVTEVVEAVGTHTAARLMP